MRVVQVDLVVEHLSAADELNSFNSRLPSEVNRRKNMSVVCLLKISLATSINLHNHADKRYSPICVYHMEPLLRAEFLLGKFRLSPNITNRQVSLNGTSDAHAHREINFIGPQRSRHKQPFVVDS